MSAATIAARGVRVLPSLPPRVKRWVLIALAVVILVSHWINMVWLVTPVFHPAHVAVHWLQVTTTIGLGGLWVGLFLWLREARPAVPMPGPAAPARIIQYARR